MSNLTPEQRIDAIKIKINDLKTKKIQAQAQLQILQPQYDSEVQKLHQLGVTDLSNIPALVTSLEAELHSLLSQLETNIATIETQVL